MKLQDILPKISENDNWGKDYRRYVRKFIAYAKERTHVNEWKFDVRDQLFRSVNCISSLRQGNFHLNEREIIQEHWDELIEPLGVIVDNPNIFCIEQCYEITRIIKKHTEANRPAASLRFLSAFQPSQLSTTVTWYYLDEIYNSIKNAGVDLPEGYGGDLIQKSHYIQSFLKNSYPDVDDIERGTYAWRLPDLLGNLKKSAIPQINTTTEEDPLSISADIFATSEVLKMPLAIPDYQRPYVWNIANIEQMLSDIKNSMEQGKRKYRIGSIILHNNDLVDGQQRITTICLIKLVWAMMVNVDKEKDTMCVLKYAHELSFKHIQENYDYINKWFNALPESRRMEFASYLEKCCEFVVVRITGQESLSLAFKLFDSQNGRGKPLEAYNLLKAYHLRAMSASDEIIKISCDREWEQNTRYERSRNDSISSYDILKHLFDEQLYRTRIWCRNTEAWSFTKKRIKEFKGMQIDKLHNVDFPFQNKQLLLFMTEKFYQTFLKETMPTCSRFNDGDGLEINPFVTMTQPIVNGKNFFEYIRSYAEIYKKLFLELDSYQMYDFKVFYKKNCLSYYGHWRTGDNYIREMYKSLIMLLFDKFGENGVNDYHRHLYVIAYYLRRKQSRVYYSTVAKYPSQFFSLIENAKDISALRKLESIIAQPEYCTIDNGRDFPPYDDVLKSIK